MRLNELVQEVQQEVPDAPLLTIRSMLAWAARDLCTEADVWVQRNQPAVVAANTDYPEVSASEGEPLRVLALTINGKRVHQGTAFEQTSPTSIQFSQRPTQSLIYGDVACRPRHGDMPPQDVLDRWGHAIADGARWRLLLMPQPWRSPEMATYYNAQYRSAISEAKQLARLGHGQGGAQVKQRRFI